MAARISRVLLRSRLCLSPRALGHVRPQRTVLAQPAVSVGGPLFAQGNRRQFWRRAKQFTEEKPFHVDLSQIKPESVTKVHFEKQDFAIVDRPLERHVIAYFVHFIRTGHLPSGKRTALPILAPGESSFLMAPSAEWAPAPFNKDPVPAVQHIMERLGTQEDSERLVTIGKNIQAMKSRLTAGLAPFSRARWIVKGLDEPEQLDTAVEHLTAVLAAFKYLNHKQVRVNMRETFNLIAGHLEDFGGALNARRRVEDPGLPTLDLPALWEQYIRAKYEAMTALGNSWIVARVKELQEQTLDAASAATDLPADQKEKETEKVAQRLQRLIDVVGRADLDIRLSMEGYRGYKTPTEITPGLHNPDLESYEKEYTERFTALGYPIVEKCIHAQAVAGTLDTGAAVRERFAGSLTAQDHLRVEIRGAPTSTPPVPWIEFLLESCRQTAAVPPEERHKYGVVLPIYRTGYKTTDEEWKAVRRNVETHLLAWGDGVPGAEDLKPQLEVQWFDCKELGLDPSDTDAIKRHYQSIRKTELHTHKLNPNFFLIIDDLSAGSYTSQTRPPPDPRTKKLYLESVTQGSLLAIDPDFSAEAATEDDQSADTGFPAFKGQMRILTNLVWPDLYASLMLQTGRLEDLWPLAMEHPGRLYTGPAVPSEIRNWRQQEAIQGPMYESFIKFLEKKDPKMAEKVRRLRELQTM